VCSEAMASEMTMSAIRSLANKLSVVSLNTLEFNISKALWPTLQGSSRTNALASCITAMR